MHRRISCNAAFKLLHCGMDVYIGFDDSVPSKVESRIQGD
jgi:hypothetical protein